MNLPVTIREEGSILPDGVSITNNKIGRIHINFKEVMASGQIRILHFCIPREDAFDLENWYVDDSVHDPVMIDEWYLRGADKPREVGSI